MSYGEEQRKEIETIKKDKSSLSYQMQIVTGLRESAGSMV